MPSMTMGWELTPAFFFLFFLRRPAAGAAGAAGTLLDTTCAWPAAEVAPKGTEEALGEEL